MVLSLLEFSFGFYGCRDWCAICCLEVAFSDSLPTIFQAHLHICKEFLELSSGFLGGFCLWIICSSISPVDCDALWFWSYWYLESSLDSIVSSLPEWKLLVSTGGLSLSMFYLLGCGYFIEKIGPFGPHHRIAALQRHGLSPSLREVACFSAVNQHLMMTFCLLSWYAGEACCDCIHRRPVFYE
jgi:hypothetical protein